jgi:hypothetical protein
MSPERFVMMRHVGSDDSIVSKLRTDEREALVRAVQAVTARDVDQVRELLENSDDAEGFWVWADDYGAGGRLALVMPPGAPEEWAIDGVALNDGSGFALEVPMWTTTGKTDLTLQLTLLHQHAGTARVVVEDLHVL